MADSTSRSLKQLRTLQRAYDPVSSAEKLSALNRLAPAEMDSAHQVSELHDLLCFLRTYPDNEEVLKLADHMLENFGERADLKRFAPALYDSGIVGTTIHSRFYWQTSLWLYRKWPLQLHIDWSEWEDTHGLDELWPLILPYPAIEALETTLLSSRELIDLLKRDNETDAGYLMRSLLRLAVQDFVREKYYDDLDVPLRLEPGKSTPSLTRSRRNPPQPVFGYTPATTRVPDFSIMDAAPESVENVTCTRSCMQTRLMCAYSATVMAWCSSVMA
jgi:hypothetical protein